MALVRILVDGYSLLHHWPDLAPGKPRYSAAARDELVQMLARYHDAAGIPITVFFDGAGSRSGPPEQTSAPEVEVLFSRAGQTADQMIERAAFRFSAFGEVLAVTDDTAERETVINMGNLASSCGNFIQTIESALADQRQELKHYNRRERNQFNRRQ